VSLVETRRRAYWLPTAEEVETEHARRSLRAFIEQAWPVLEPATPFVPGWHIDAIAEHLEAVTRGEIRDLVINIPPRHNEIAGRVCLLAHVGMDHNARAALVVRVVCLAALDP
jgi:hypothetical protein